MDANVDELIQTIRRLPPMEKEYILSSILDSTGEEYEVRDLRDIESQYPDEWLAMAIPPEEDRYNPQRGRLLVHSRDKSFIWQHVKQSLSRNNVYVFYNGLPASKGFGIRFYDTTDTSDVATVGD